MRTLLIIYFTQEKNSADQENVSFALLIGWKLE
jgi:hypothetical protein